MPRNVRNFWIRADVDGRAHSFEAGPARRDGGFRLVILMRHDGAIVTAASIEGRHVAAHAADDGAERLQLIVGAATAPGLIADDPGAFPLIAADFRHLDPAGIAAAERAAGSSALIVRSAR